ncbi:MAG: hypothetical protein ACR2KW_06060 [Rubrobacter sp.]
MAVLNLTMLFIIGTVLTHATLIPARKLLPKRTNYAGKSVLNATGIVFVPIILLTVLFTVSERNGDAFVFAAYLLLAVGVGYLDDVRGDGGARGFRGHIGALLKGQLTTGMVKVLGLGGGALVLGWWVFGVSISALFGAFLLAGWANLGNLFDLRPGRAIKFTMVPALPLLLLAPGWTTLAVAGVIGGIFSLFYFDVRGRIMLGDAGAAVCGSVVGLLVVSYGPGVTWIIAGLLVVSLTLVAEFSSISRFIEEVGALRWFDSWGRMRDK